jgi:hypothetical protein
VVGAAVVVVVVVEVGQRPTLTEIFDQSADPLQGVVTMFETSSRAAPPKVPLKVQ